MVIDKKKRMPKLICKNGNDTRTLRRKLGLSQSEFWGALQVTQSGGSRYESGRDMPEQVALLLHLAFGTQKQSRELLEWLRGTSSR